MSGLHAQGGDYQAEEPREGFMGEGDSKLVVDPADLGIGRLFNEIRDAVIVGEAITEKIVLWNRAASKVFGYSEADALGKPIHMLMPPRLRARHRAGLARFVATGEGPLMTEGSIIEVPGMLASGDARLRG